MFRLPPWYANIGKRLIKSPKLNFYDIGLAAWLCGIETISHIEKHPLRSNLFENLVIVESLLHRVNQGKTPNLYFFRDTKGMEVDLLYPEGPRFIPIEIKASKTHASDFLPIKKNYKHSYQLFLLMTCSPIAEKKNQKYEPY